jgi:hypothetical protein
VPRQPCRGAVGRAAIQRRCALKNLVADAKDMAWRFERIARYIEANLMGATVSRTNILINLD